MDICLIIIMDSGKLSYNIDNIFGSTSTSVHLLAHAQGCLVYVSGSFIVFYSPKLDEQVAYLRHSSSLVTAIAVTPDEKLLAVADRAKPPTVSVYNISSLEALRGGSERAGQVLRGHKHSVDLLAFSPNGKYLLSLSNHDGSMFLWEKGECLTKNRVSKTVARAVFDAKGDLVTVGRGYLKVWRFNGGEVSRRKEEECWIMEGRVLTFGKTFSSKDFVELVFYGEKVLLLSSDGMLCIMAANYEKVEKWIDLVMPKAVGLKVVGSLALCGGDNALIKSVDLESLTLRHKFPKPPPPSKENLNDEEELGYGEEEEFPACQAILQVSDFIVTLYSSRTIFIWQLGEEPVAVRSIISHRAAVHALALLQEVKGDICFFASASEDGTVRLWHFYKK
jgi:WD40 repeat protein